MVPQPGKQTVAIHILSNTSRSKRKQTIKLGQYNMRNNFHKKSYTKCDRELEPFPTRQK